MSNILKYQNPSSPLLNPHKIIENIPAREWGPRKINEDGTITEGEGTNFWRAPFQYLGNKGLGIQNEKLARDLVSEFDQMRSENPDYNYILDKNYQSYDDAINYLNHLEGLKKYLQIPYDTGLLMESEYKPTRLQGTNEKTYKFKSSTVPGYWDDVVDDMVIGEHDKNQYYDQSLNEFTAYRDRDEKGDFVSIYDEWDYNPAVRGGNKKLNKVVDSVTGGKPFVIYDRIYLDDHYDVPEEARGNPFITPAVVTANAKHENGGILKVQEGTGNLLTPHLLTPHPLSPISIALNQAKAMAKMKGEQQHLPPGVKEVIGPDGKAHFIRTEQPLQPLEQSIAEWLPGTGDVAEVGYIANDVKNGNLGSAALAAAMIALPGNVGKILRKTEIPNTVSSANQKFLNAIKRNDIEQTLVEIKNKNIDIAKIKQMLKNTGVEEELLTDDNIQRLVAARQLDYINQNSVNKMALRYDNKRYNDLEYDLYRKGNTNAVGYIRAFDTQKDFVNDVGDTFPQFVDVDFVRNTSNVRGVSEQGYNAIIGDLGHVDSGRMVLSPKHTAAVHAKYPDKTLIGMFGDQKGFDEAFPVYRLNNATYPVPVKYLDTFGLEGLSPEGTFIVDFDKGPTFKFGGKMK